MRQFLLGVFLVLTAGGTAAADGLITIASAHSVPETTDRLARALEGKGFRIFARVDHGAGARSVDLELPATQLLIFGRPEAGSRLMQSQRTVGIDLPMKYLVWEDADGSVTIAWNDALWLAERHGIAGDTQVVGTMATALRQFAEQAAQ